MQNKVRAKKSLGQNFLQDTSVVERMIESLAIERGDILVEIGPGLGALTRKLVENAGTVIAVEFDRDMVAVLEKELGQYDNFQIISSDALKMDFEEVVPAGGTAKLAANLPYNISTPILLRLIAFRSRFSRLVLMFQKEVVDRILATPGSSERGYLTVLVENAFHAERLIDVPPDAFEPVPKVHSSVVVLTPRESSIDDQELERIASVAFRQKRKTVLNNLKPTYAHAAVLLEGASIDPSRRAETLTREEWGRLIDILAARK